MRLKRPNARGVRRRLICSTLSTGIKTIIEFTHLVPQTLQSPVDEGCDEDELEHAAVDKDETGHHPDIQERDIGHFWHILPHPTVYKA